MADPDLMADDDPIGAPLRKKALIPLRRVAVIFGAIGEAMQEWAIDRMVRRTDSDLRGDGAEPDDPRVRHHAASAEIGKVAKLGIFDCGVAEDFTAADPGLPEPDRGRDHGFGDFWTRDDGLVHGAMIIHESRAAETAPVAFR